MGGLVSKDSANNSTSPHYMKKLAASSIIRVWTYKKGPQVIRLELKSNTIIRLDIRLEVE